MSGAFCRVAGVLAAISVAAAGAARAETVVLAAGSDTLYSANTSSPGDLVDAEWFLPGFDDSGWSSGSFGIGYEDAPPGASALIATTVPSGSLSVYTRTTFQVADASSVFSLHLGLDFDDGVVAWINGVEVYRSPEMRALPLAWNAAPVDGESSNGTAPDYEPLRNVSQLGIPALVDGTNVLAIGVWNSAAGSPDLVLVPRLSLNKMLTRGPYLQQGSASGVVVRWRTGAETNSRVAYGTLPTDLSLEVTDGALTTEHELALAGLAPNTRYYYSVGSTTETLAGPEVSFVTAPSGGTPKPTRIWVLGDSGHGNGNAERVRDAYASFTGGQSTELWLMLGDNAYDLGTDQEFQDNLFDIYPEMLAGAVLWPTIGNHDLFDGMAQTWPYYDGFTLPQQAEAGGVASGTEAYYAFDYANIHFVVLDSQDSPSGPGSAMHTWLAADLASTDQPWIVAFWHHPPYSKGHDSDDPADSNGRLIAMRQNVVPVLEDYGVDLVLTGHSHSYERSYLIDGHYGSSATWNPATMLKDGGDGDDPPYMKPERGDVPYAGSGDGAVYTVTGSASHTTYGVGQSLGGTQPDHPVMLRSLFELGSVILEVNGNRLDATFLGDQAAILDQFTIIKGAPPQAPVADFAASPLLAAPAAPVDFADLSLHQPTVWAWDFDANGQPDSNQPSAAHAYAQSGLYTAALTVWNSAGWDQEQKSGYVCVTGGLPGPVTGLGLHGDRATISWDTEPNATGYDVVRGDLMLARATGGFAGTQLGCVVSAGAPSVSDPALPPPGGILYYLARARNCVPQTGTYDTGLPGQAAARDLALQGGGVCACAPGDDADGDGYCTAFDNCPGFASLDLTDLDRDGAGDVCDVCPYDPANDGDADGVCGNVDNCPNAANSGQENADGDPPGNACDGDDDNDGILDVQDPAPLDPDLCGDSDGDDCDDCAVGTDDFGPLSDAKPLSDGPDFDADGLCDVGDTCFDVDGDGLGNGTAGNAGCDHPATDSNDGDVAICADVDGDACDDCQSGSWNPANDGTDTDGDGICNAGDNCDTVPGSQADFDSDGIGDLCDPCTDRDGDGFGDPGFTNQCPLDNCPDTVNPTQADSDGDGKGNLCDVCPLDPMNDADMDFVCGNVDNCPTVNNPGQQNTDGDTLGNACDPDDDNDSVIDGADSDPYDRFRCGDWDADGCEDCSSGSWDMASDGVDFDGDGLCDGGDNDDDNDGVVDGQDLSPQNANACRDVDRDGCDDCASGHDDPSADGFDSDGDGICDLGDVCPGGDDTVDSDADGVPDFCDACPEDPTKVAPGTCGCGTPDGDADGDTLADCLDCAPQDATNAPPAEIGNTVVLSRQPGGTLISWLAEVAPGPFQLYAGLIVPLFTYNHTCAEAPIAGTQTTHTIDPAPGDLLYFLIARQGCGISGLGTASDGSPRPNPTPCGAS